MTVREFLQGYNELKGYPVDDEGLIETLTEDGEEVSRTGRDMHRWYLMETVVKKIDNRFIQFQDYTVTGDNCASDMGLEYDLDAAKLVEKKERQITEVYYE